MAEPTLSLAYADFQYEVARFLGWDTNTNSWTTQNNTDFAYILKRGLRQFYFPPTGAEDKPYYEWSFLRQIGNTTLAANTATYTLADNCSGSLCDFTANYASSSKHRRLEKIPEADLRALQAMDPQTGWPTSYAVRPKEYDAVNGHRYEMLLYPTPGTLQANAVISYYYIVVPNTIDSTNKYPIGGGLYSEAILASILAAAENLIENDPAGPQYNRFITLLSQAMRDDERKKNPGRGGNQ